MKILCTLLTVFLAIVFGPRASAADDAKAERREKVREHIAASMADLELTDAQEAKIAEIRKECRPKIQEAAKALATIGKEEIEQVNAVLTPQQRETRSKQKAENKERRHEGLCERIAHLNDLDLTEAELAQISEIREQYRPQIESLLKELAGVLTDEQKEARMEALQSGESRRDVRESLDLTEDQRQKVESIGKELAKVMRQKLQKINSVLSPEQQENVAEAKAERREHVRDRRAHMIENAKDLNLTSEQKTKIADIRKEFRPKIHTAGNTLRSTVRDELSQILTTLES